MCVATKTFEPKTCLVVRSGGSSAPRYVQKCTVEGSRSGCGPESGEGGYCPISLCTHSGQVLLLRAVHVVACVAEGALGRAALCDSREGGTVSWELLRVVPNRIPKKATNKVGLILRVTMAPFAVTW